MELQSVTAKVDALREKGFSDSEINQLLDVPTSNSSENTVTSMSPELLMEQVKKGNTQILRQFSKGKDPEIFNAKIDEIVEFLEKDTKFHFRAGIAGWSIFIIFMLLIESMTSDISFTSHVALSGMICLLAFKFILIKQGIKNRYAFLKPRLLYFMHQ